MNVEFTDSLICHPELCRIARSASLCQWDLVRAVALVNAVWVTNQRPMDSQCFWSTGTTGSVLMVVLMLLVGRWCGMGEWSPVIPSGQENVNVVMAVFPCDLILSTMFNVLKKQHTFFPLLVLSKIKICLRLLKKLFLSSRICRLRLQRCGQFGVFVQPPIFFLTWTRVQQNQRELMSSPVQLSDSTPASFEDRYRHPFFFSECCHKVIKKRSSGRAWDGWDLINTHWLYYVRIRVFFFFFLWFTQHLSEAKKISATASQKQDKNKTKKASTKKQVGLGPFHITAWQMKAAPDCSLRTCAYRLGSRHLCVQVKKMCSCTSLYIYHAFLCVKKKKIVSPSGIPNV